MRVVAAELASAGDGGLDDAPQIEAVRLPATGRTVAPHVPGLGLRTEHLTRFTPQRLRREQGDADRAHRPRARRHPHLASGHRGQGPRKRMARRRLALEEDALAEAPVAHHAVPVVADHRVLQPGEDVLAREALRQRLGGDVGDEHGAGLSQVGGPRALRGQFAEAGDVVDAVDERLFLEEAARSGAADAIHVGLEDAPVLEVDELGVLTADLDDREAAAAVRVEPAGGHGVRDDLVLDREARRERREGGTYDGRGGVAARAGQADRHDRFGGHLGDLRDQRLRRLHGIAVGAAVDIGDHGSALEADERGLGARRAEVEAKHDGLTRPRRGRGLEPHSRVVKPHHRARRVKPHHRARPVGRRRQGAYAPRRRRDESLGVVRPARARRAFRVAGRGAPGGLGQRAERLEDRRLGWHGDGHAGELLEGPRHGPQQGPVADQHHGAVDAQLVVQPVDVARHALEQPAEQPAVVLTLVGVVGELALREHGTAARHDEAVRAGLGQPDGLLQIAPQTAAQALHGLAGPGRAALVRLERQQAGSVTGQHRVAAAADADDGEGRLVPKQRAGRTLLGDLFGQAAAHGGSQPLAVGPGADDRSDVGRADLAVQVEEGTQRLPEMTLAARLRRRERPVGQHFRPGQAGRDLAEVGADGERWTGTPGCAHAPSIRQAFRRQRSTGRRGLSLRPTGPGHGAP